MENSSGWSATRYSHLFLRHSKLIKINSILGIRNFVVGVIVKAASDEGSLRKDKTYINKLNLALVQACFLIRRASLSA